MVSIRHPHSTFHNMIFTDSQDRIYLSYHISESRKTRHGIEEINRFRQRMHEFGHKEQTPIFDPLAIDERAIIFALQKARALSPDVQTLRFQEEDRWPIKITNTCTEDVKWPIEIPANEIDQVVLPIDDQIRSRDYTLVDTATHLVVYRPFFNGKRSLGVDAEIKRANETFSNVMVYHPESDKTEDGVSTHPFGSNITTFEDQKEFMAHIRNIIQGRKRKHKNMKEEYNTHG